VTLKQPNNTDECVILLHGLASTHRSMLSCLDHPAKEAN